MTQKNDRAINLAYYNRFQVDVEEKKIENIGFYVYTPNTVAPNPKTKEICFYENLEVTANRKLYNVNLSGLKIPDWWYTTNNISPNEKISPDLRHVLYFNIGTASAPVLDAKSSLRIHAMAFKRNNEKLALLLVATEFIIFLLLVIIHYTKGYMAQKSVPVTIAYKPVAVEHEEKQLHSFLNFINNNFHDHDLTLEQVSTHTGINQRRIANHIQQNFGCNFKTYVNQIRINESKRLLSESGLNMGEIAFKVGFSNQSHFNRVFKNLTGVSPSEFRENQP